MTFHSIVMWYRGLSDRTKTWIHWCFNAVIVGWMTWFLIFAGLPFWFSFGFSGAIFLWGYIRGERNMDRSWQWRYDHLQEHYDRQVGTGALSNKHKGIVR